MSKYEDALTEVRSVLDEWMPMLVEGKRVDSPHTRTVVSERIVERLVAKGVIQSTDPEELGYRTGPLQPGTRVTGGPR